MSLLHCNFTTESASERILKILKTVNIWGSCGKSFATCFFLTHGVQCLTKFTQNLLNFS